VSQNQRVHLVNEDEEHKVSTIELFFDLVFVYAITPTTQLMANHYTVLGLAQGLAMLAVLWWCWCAYAWLGNTVHVDRGVTRFAIFGAMAMMFLASMTIPEAFTNSPGGLYGPIMFVACYFAVRMLHLVAFFQAAKDAALRRTVLHAVPSLLLSVAILAGAAFTTGLVQMSLWILALAFEYGGVYYIARRAGGRLTSPAHFAERFRLIVIIALGESILNIGIGIRGFPMSWLVALAGTCGLALAAGMWWMYFDVVAHASEHKLISATGIERAKIASDSYAYLHLPLIAGIVLAALGLMKALHNVADTGHHTASEAMHGTPIWALTAGVAMYLIALSALRRRNLGRWDHQQLVLAAVLLAVTPALEHVPAAALVGIVAAAPLGLAAFESFLKDFGLPPGARRSR
jgi:low temperature requirement protein LtrA